MTKKLSKEAFIKTAKEKHGDKYDYSLVEYIGNKIKVKIICKKHGIFEQSPEKHKTGQNCPKCSIKQLAKKNSLSFEQFIEKADKIHGNKYDYSISKYKNHMMLINIGCPIHGIFKQRANNHLNGQGCPECGGSKNLTLKQFVNKSKKIHDNYYKYDLVEYKNNNTKVKIICPKHGSFNQVPKSHMKGFGCNKCRCIETHASKQQQQFYKQISKTYSKAILEYVLNVGKKTYYIDIYIPEKNIIIEYNGDYWHCNPKLYEKNYLHPHLKLKAKNIWERDKKKKNELEKLGYKVIIVWESDWKNHKEKILIEEIV